MPIGVKCLFTAAVVLVGILIYFIDPDADNAGPDWLWSGGKKDPFRNLICREDGTLRKQTKLSIYLWFELVLIIMWLDF
ncbi:MAG: hypothetical protein KDA70_07790 [Planctomycetaceae bacterium]|nr:hypothetical protein [Planctomycetaceae bacterium]